MSASETLRGDLLLADRGDFDWTYLRAVNQAGGHFVVRARVSVNPTVRGVYPCEGDEWEEWCEQTLKQCALSKEERVVLDVVRGRGAEAWEARLEARWNPEEESYTLLVTNLPWTRMTAEQVDRVYRLRWQIELLFKEWKSYANPHALDTNHAGTAEGLIRAAIAASALKR